MLAKNSRTPREARPPAPSLTTFASKLAPTDVRCHPINHRLPEPAVPDSYVFSEQVGHLLRKAYQRHLAIFQQNVGDSQLTAVQFVTLCALRDHGASSLTELVKATAVDQATIRGIVERLKARELITLEPDPQDKRKVVVNLSDSGAALVQQTVPCAATITELTLSNLNPAERVAVLFLLRKMIDDPQN